MDGNEPRVGENEKVCSIGINVAKQELTTIKRSLNSIVKDGPYKERFINAIKARCNLCTEWAVLSSLLVQFKIMKSIEEGDFHLFDDSGAFINDCFMSLFNDSYRPLPSEFQIMMEENGIQRPSSAYLSNLKQYTINQYATNFENNVKMHHKRRLKLYFSICEDNEHRSYTEEDIENTLKYMLEHDSTVQPNWSLIYKIPNRSELLNEYARGFFDDLIENSWFKTVFIFIAIQSAIQDHQIRCNEHPELELKNVKNFVVVPLHSHHRKHIRIDNAALHEILKELKIDPKKSSKPTKRHPSDKRQMFPDEFNSAKRKHWMNNRDGDDYQGPFDAQKIRRMEKQQKKFDYQIVTDGISASILFTNRNRGRLICNNEEYMQQLRTRMDNCEILRQIGVDPGYKIWIAAVIRYLNGKEVNVKITSKQFHKSTGMKKRERKRKRLTKVFEDAAAADREARSTEIGIYPTPCGDNWADYVEHRLSFFNRGIAAYCTDKVARLDLDKHFCTQRVMDKIVEKVVGNDRSLVCIGSANFAPNSPIKKYIRCPGTKLLERHLKKKRHAHILKVDEYRTSQVCPKCYQDLEQQLRRDRQGKLHRYKICLNCVRPAVPILEPPEVVITDKSRRMLTKERQAYPNQRPKSKKIRIVQNNQANFEDANGFNVRQINTTWNRDTSGSLNILVKGTIVIRFVLSEILVIQLICYFIAGICVVNRIRIPNRLSRIAMNQQRARERARREDNAA